MRHSTVEHSTVEYRAAQQSTVSQTVDRPWEKAMGMPLSPSTEPLHKPQVPPHRDLTYATVEWKGLECPFVVVGW